MKPLRSLARPTFVITIFCASAIAQSAPGATATPEPLTRHEFIRSLQAYRESLAEIDRLSEFLEEANRKAKSARAWKDVDGGESLREAEEELEAVITLNLTELISMHNMKANPRFFESVRTYGERFGDWVTVHIGEFALGKPESAAPFGLVAYTGKKLPDFARIAFEWRDPFGDLIDSSTQKIARFYAAPRASSVQLDMPASRNDKVALLRELGTSMTDGLVGGQKVCPRHLREPFSAVIEIVSVEEIRN